MDHQQRIRRASDFCERHGLTAERALGFGVHGNVFVAVDEVGDRFAVKIHDTERFYRIERDVYARLASEGITSLRGCEMPEVFATDDELWVLCMGIVTPPYVLDFTGSYLDREPDFPEDVLAEWRAEKAEQFGRH